MKNIKDHWEKVYTDKQMEEVSWYQPKSETSLEYIQALNLKKGAGIIDIGGGDSFLAENLLAEGFKNISVLDISESAIERAKSRLGDKAEKIKWILEDVTGFSPSEEFDLWHDRATFHFLTEKQEVQDYLETVRKSVKKGGAVIIATFSEKGPEKCSGISVRQYSLHELSELFRNGFETQECKNIDHITPSGKIQNFSFCRFKRI